MSRKKRVSEPQKLPDGAEKPSVSTIPQPPTVIPEPKMVEPPCEPKDLIRPPQEKREKKSLLFGILAALLILSVIVNVVVMRELEKTNDMKPNFQVNETIVNNLNQELINIYKPNEQVRVLTLFNSSSRCVIDIYYPNGSLFRNRNMSGVNFHNYNFTAPNATGVYTLISSCGKQDYSEKIKISK